jgi:predicted acetyltransferase
MSMATETIAIVDAWCVPSAREFFINVWPMYVHELSGFDTDFYSLDARGRWLPDIAEDWSASVTPGINLREPRADDDPTQPYQRTHVITSNGRPVGFVCLGTPPFKYMPAEEELTIFEFFLIRAARGTATATRALELVLQRYAGCRRHLRVIHDNTRALRFWRKALPAVGAREIEESSEQGDVVFRFVGGGSKDGV